MYKPFTNDVLAEIKQTYIRTQLISMAVSISLIILICIFSKTKKILLKCLKIIAILSSIVILIFFGIKIKLNTTYTKEKITELSKIRIEESEKNNITKSKFREGIKENTGDLIDNLIIKENIKAYSIFKIKSMLNIVIYIGIVIFDMYLIRNIINRQTKEEKLTKEDNIFYDEEENVKY